MRRFPVSALGAVGDRLELDPAASHHLLRVVGVAPGEMVELFDRRGGVCRARLVGVDAGLARLEVCAVLPSTHSPTTTWLVLAQLKSAAMDAAVRMATELGVTGIWPVQAQRSIGRGDRRNRWARVASAAAAQCGRCDVPELRAPTPLTEALAELGGEVTGWLCLPGGGRPSPGVVGPAAVLVGPEGGWTPDEEEAAVAAGFVRVNIAPFTLRAQTAAAAALATLYACRAE